MSKVKHIMNYKDILDQWIETYNIDPCNITQFFESGNVDQMTERYRVSYPDYPGINQK